MKKTLTRLFTVALLLMVSLGARAEVKVLFGVDGTELQPDKDGKVTLGQKELTGGTVIISQEDQKNGTTELTLAVTPDKGYRLAENGLEVYTVAPADISQTRTVKASTKLDIKSEDFKDEASKRTYTATIDSNLALWLKSANFQPQKRDGAKGTDYSGTYFIASQNSKGTKYNASSPATNFYLVPAADPQLKNCQDAFYSSDYNVTNGDPEKPFLTTALTNLDDNSAWKITKTNGYYTIQHVVTRKYIVYEPPHSDKPNRKSVHLLATDDPGEIGLFDIQQGSGGYTIRPLSVEEGNRYFNPANTNYNDYHGHEGDYNCNGLVGLYSDNKDNSLWHLESVPANNSYTFNVIDSQGNIAVKKTVDSQQSLAMLKDYNDIPEDIRSPYLAGETVTFYSFDGDYSSDKLTDENIITATPYANNSNIYVTYTLDHLSEKFLRLRGARALNIVTSDGYAYDNSGTLAYDNDAANKTQPNHLWNISGGDPYAVQIDNLGTGRYLVSSTMPTLSLAETATNKFILMEESAATSADYEPVKLMKATGTEDLVVTRAEFQASLVSITTKYHLIDKAGKLIQGNIESESSELGLPDEWRSPLVSEYHYYKTSGLSGDTYSPSDQISNPLEVGEGGDIYVTYDVSGAIDLTGGKSYLLKFLDGVSFNQEDGHDARLSTPTKAIYPYNNGDFNLYVYGQEQWESQLASGASTRTRWLWKIVSRHNGTDLTGDNIDPYHVVVKSHQNQTVKDKKNGADYNYPGNSYLQTYKPSDYSSVITNIAYENNEYPADYPSTMSTTMVNGQPTEYMILGTSLNSISLKTFNTVEGERRIVNSFEQYWKNNPTVHNLVGDNPAADNATLTGLGWHQFTSWAYSAPWDNTTKGLAEGTHWYQTISMGTGQFTVEEVSLTPQVILLDQHGWEIVRIPMYKDNDFTEVNTEGLSKYNSPMVSEYHWYPKADKVSGYHKYNISVPSSYSSNSLSTTPHGNLEGYADLDKKNKSDFYVTYTVKPEYANSYTGAATANATVASAVRIKQDGKYAATDGSQINPIEGSDNQEDIPDNMQWYLRPNFNIDREMGYRYAGETGAHSEAKSQTETEAENFANGKNGFDPYNVQIQSKKNTQRYFTANTSASALANGVWTGNSSSLSLQNMTTTSRQTATGYDQTTLLITNATFMVVDDGHGNMRLMPRFDHSTVMQSFTTLAEQNTEADASQTLLLGQAPRLIHSSSEMTSLNGRYILASDFTFANDYVPLGTSEAPFSGIIDGQLFTLSGVTKPIIAYANGAVIKNVILENVDISSGTNVGAICCEAIGATRIYNCGILPTTTERDKEGNITGFTGSRVGGSNDVGGIVGKLSGNARVINCFSYATITGGSTVAGIVGNIGYAANTSITQDDVDSKPMVVNCMFYGDITGGTSVSPVYGGATGAMIKNDNTKGVNPYCYFRRNSSFNNTTNLVNINAFKRSWPAEEKNLTRFEYYRSILNSNRKLCTWWVNGTNGTAPTDENVNNVDIAKWVLDPGIAPYPILKKWGKYPSVINIDPDKVWDPRTEIKEGDVVTPVTPHWVQRSTANEWEGKSYGTLPVTINAGAHGSGSTSRNIAITDMDTLNCDYSYYKIQLPYYNEVFGNPNGATHAEKYGGNYTEYVVTGWEIEAAGSTTATDYNFADRNSINGRVFAQGGYYYVPKDVTSITITARWGKAIYLSNRGRSIDRVNVTNANYKSDSPFTPAGTIPDTFQDQPVYDDLQNAIKALGTNTDSPTVYDQAIVLIGNHQVKNGNNDVGYNLDSKWHPFTIMSADFDFDNEPDYCLQLQFRDGTPRPGIQPIRFDFLPVVELGLALRHNSLAYAIGIFVPQGHFEVTETAFMRTTQFEYDGFQSYTDRRIEAKSPVIINGGEYEMFVVRYHDSNRTSYFLLGGNAWIHRFAPGAHPSNANPKIYLCPINVIGGQVKELYLTGLYRPKLPAPTNQGAPRCYTDGGKFDIMAGAGYEKVEAGSNVTFKINHSKITEFYGGGINATNPISGNIDVTIDNSYVDKYCGGPKVGDMTGKTVTTHATGTTFGVFYGGGNGGNSYYRDLQKDGDMASSHIGTWTDNNYNWNGFKPLEVKDDGTDNKGYHAEYEFEVFNHSNGVTDQITQRGFIRWIQFGITITGNVANTLTDCTVNTNFYGGGNLATVNGTVTSTLTNTNVKGNVFGAGYSADIPTFTVHDKNKKVFPSMDFAGTITDGYIPNKQEDNEDIKYEWTNELNGKTEEERKADPAYSKTVVEDGIEVKKWYCYTWNSLDNLGAVLNDVTLTLGGDSKVGTEGNPETGNVYGGGDASAVKKKEGVADSGNTTVILQGNAEVLGNVFGGGNKGLVEGSATVNIQ